MFSLIPKTFLFSIRVFARNRMFEGISSYEILKILSARATVPGLEQSLNRYLKTTRVLVSGLNFGV